MKKLLFALIVTFAFCGSIFAQPASHWPDFNPSSHESQGSLVAAISIDGNMVIPTTYDYYNEFGDYYVSYKYEVAAFVGEECRGVGFLHYYEGDSYPTTDMMAIHYDRTISDTGVEVTFKMFDHVNQIEYIFCTTNKPIFTGEEYIDFNDDYIVRLNFSSSFIKEIIPYTGGNNGWYLIASPIDAGISPDDVLNMTEPYDYDLFAFDQSADLEWLNYKSGAFELLKAGRGYLYANAGGENGEPVILTFSGTPYDGDGTIPLYKNDSANLSGWNLVGNPFAHTAYIDKPFYTMNEDGSEIVPGVGNEIGAMEGIFVIAEENEETMTFSTEPIEGKGQIVLNVSKNDRGNAIDRAIVRFTGDMLPKFMLNQNNTKMYIPNDGDDFAVVRSTNSDRLPVNFKPAQDGNFTISVNPENVNMKYMHLVDNLTGADIDLLITPSYSFDARTTDLADRFVLAFKVGIDPMPQSFEKDDTYDFGYFIDGKWIINNEGDAVLQVVDINGQILSNEEINGSVSKHIDAAPGVYMLRLIKGKDIKVQKIVIK